jgi:hypothetical protein
MFEINAMKCELKIFRFLLGKKYLFLKIDLFDRLISEKKFEIYYE